MPPRSYDQYCALARSLDVIGDRWSLLIVRNLLLGPLRWTDLRRDLPGIAKNLLAARLDDLQAAGVVERRDDLYALTHRGAELESVVFALGDWGERHAFGPPREGEAVRLRYLMTSLRRRLRPSRRSGWLVLSVSGEPYSVRLGRCPTVVQGERDADAYVDTDLPGLRTLLGARRPPCELVDAGGATLRGDVALVEALVDAFPSPEPRDIQTKR